MLRMITVEYGLMIEVFKLLHLVSGSSDNFSKTPMKHMILFIAVTWLVIDESTSKTSFFIQPKKKSIKT